MPTVTMTTRSLSPGICAGSKNFVKSYKTGSSSMSGIFIDDATEDRALLNRPLF